jgi:KipI family sensor histidine kinase inhibitor
MTLKPLGDSAWLVEFSADSSLAKIMGLVAALENDRPPGVLDVVPSFDSVAVHFGEADGREILAWIESAVVSNQDFDGKEVRIPVVYGGEDGPDLSDVADQVGLSEDEVIRLHSEAIYTVAAVGFSPGFPYLTGLPDCLKVPRRSTPRREVPAGSVAVAGAQAGIYPFASPGGWQILGRTSVRLFDPTAVRPALLRAGDRVKFVPVRELELPDGVETALPIAEDHWIEVIQPGALTTVQDLGRPGHEAAGVSPGGAVDRHALRVANLLVGNAEGAAVLEICMSGPVLRFNAATTVAWVGGSGKSMRVAAGETLDFSRVRGSVRAYLAVAGGLRVPMVLGSAATDVRAGFGGHHGRALRAGDRLETGKVGRIPQPGHWHVGREGRAKRVRLRVLTGVQHGWFSEEAHARLFSETYQLTHLADRMGARLSGPPLDLNFPIEMVSQPVACGSVQVPPDGQPIILLAERQTIGGYPQIAHVISADLPKLARAWPGTAVRFQRISLEEARELKRREAQDFAWLRTGLNLLK